MNRRQEYFFKTSLRPCKLSLIEMLFITIYSALWILIIPLILLLGIFSRSIKRQLSHRALGMPSFPARISESRTAVFYCSSAGEYEQAKPVIDRLRNIHQISSVIYFFSRSGYDYAQARNEQAPRFLTPPDTWLHWHSIFKRLHVGKAL